MPSFNLEPGTWNLEPIGTWNLEPVPLIAFFNQPSMLLWLAAAAAPLVIHLLNRRKHREMPWAAMQYLMAAIRKSSRRVRIEQWLLLALRTLIVVLLVLAMAEPVLEHAGTALVSGGRTHKVLVIDGSYSMAYRPAEQSRTAARSSVGPPGDKATAR